MVTSLLALATAAHAQAGNLVPAPSFDTELEFLANWENLSAGDVWTSLDFEDNPSSGSVRINDDIPGADTGMAVISPCLPVTPGTIYQFSAWQFTPSPQPVVGYAALFLEWRDSCPSGALVGFPTVTSDVTLAWTFFSAVAPAPVSAHGARLWLSAVRTPASGTFSVYFDQAFVPEPGREAAAVTAAASLAFVRRRRPGSLLRRAAPAD